LTADEEVTRMAKRMGERVQLTGYLEEERVRAVVAGAAALVFPSLYEGFGLPPLEAMAAGRPVLASSAASIPEVCGPWATYFDPADVEQLAAALRAAANDPPSSDRLEGARRHARPSAPRHPHPPPPAGARRAPGAAPPPQAQTGAAAGPRPGGPPPPPRAGRRRPPASGGPRGHGRGERQSETPPSTGPHGS